MVEVRRGAHAARTSRPWCVSLGTRHERSRSRELLLQLRLLPPAQSARGHVVVGLLAYTSCMRDWTFRRVLLLIPSGP